MLAMFLKSPLHQLLILDLLHYKNLYYVFLHFQILIQGKPASNLQHVSLAGVQ